MKETKYDLNYRYLYKLIVVNFGTWSMIYLIINFVPDSSIIFGWVRRQQLRQKCNFRNRSISSRLRLFWAFIYKFTSIHHEEDQNVALYLHRCKHLIGMFFVDNPFDTLLMDSQINLDISDFLKYLRIEIKNLPEPYLYPQWYLPA